jgi:iron complex outermembrane recepter protein
MAAIYGDNATNVRYREAIQYTPFGAGAQWDAPATWGIEVGKKL